MKTLFEKVWDNHVVAREEDETLLYVDRCLIHEGSRHTFDTLQERGLAVAHPDKVFAFSDHYIPTDPRARAGGVANLPDPEIRNMIELLERNTDAYGIARFGWGDARQGILHVAGPELGLSQPGIVLVGADSHTSTHGAFGNLSFGIGSSETTHVVATQTIWQRRPETMRISIDGTPGFGVTAKDIILAVIARIGIGGAIGYAIEYAGSTIARMSMNERMTVCNMSIEAGGRAGMIAPDDTTYEFLAGRAFTPKGAAWDAALAFWRTLPSDPDAKFAKEVALDAGSVVPMVTWGTNPEQALPINGRVPDPDRETDGERRGEYAKALAYMGLQPNMPLGEIAIDRVFIGSCTNARIDDLRAAAAVAKLGRAVVPAWVVPGSVSVKRQAEAEGLDRIFTAAGFEWREAGCSMCTAINGDQLAPGERCASTSNRNFQGRQGPGGRTHLMSPAMAAAAALRGRLVDVRELGGRN
ncbi:MAG: 3-isopropylmalate dehydratase large subunit [Rhodospirillales bacterium]|nr:3-isopropylmalate dehydratase large subunit [Rhodospirillales bacterium]